MLGCVGTRDKALSCSTVEPFVVRGIAKSCDSATVEFGLQGVGDNEVPVDVTCNVESLEAASFRNTWAPLPGATWHYLIPDSGSESKHRGKIRCVAIVPGLQPEKDYTFRIVARGAYKELPSYSTSFIVRTSDRPKAESALLLCSRRWADCIEVEWPLADPDGAPVQECLAQCRTDMVFSSWFSQASMDTVEVSTAEGCRRWRGRICGLSGSNAYRIRAKARNAVGWSSECSPELTVRTSDLPPAPTALECVRRQPTSVTVRMLLEDPEGAPVQGCSLQLHGFMGYADHQQYRFLRMPPSEAILDGRPGKKVQTALCIVEGLQPETEYFLRLWARSDAGTATQSSLPLQVFTSERPRPPLQFSVKVGPRTIEMDFELTDPVGAPVTACEVEYSKDSMFGTWKPAHAEPVAVLEGGNVRTEEAPKMAAVTVLSGALAFASTARRWRARIDGLERETAYALRVRPVNSIGPASCHSHTERAATSDRPCSPQGLRCVARLPAAVRLEFRVPEVLGTAPVSQIVIEEASSLSWTELQEVEVSKLDKGLPGFSYWSVLVSLGMEPAVTHRLRAWALNDFGRCSEASEVCACRSSDRPDVLPNVSCVERLPHALVLGWSATDPEGAPVCRFEVQSRRDQVLAGWHSADCADTVRCAVSDSFVRGYDWRCVVGQLEPASTYRFCVRAMNEVGWSPWYTTEIPSIDHKPFQTSVPPPLPKAVVVHSVSDASGTEKQLLVDVLLPDSEGAPVTACMVKCRSSIWTLCRRDRKLGVGRWRAAVPSREEVKDKGVALVRIRAANAVGWTNHEQTVAVTPQTNMLSTVQDSGSVDLVYREVQKALEAQFRATERLAQIALDATSRGDHEHAALLAKHRVETSKCHEVLAEVQQQVGSALSAPGEDQGAVLVAQFTQSLARRKLVPNAPAAAKILSLLLRGWMWLETTWRSEFDSLSKGIEKAMKGASASGGRILLHWVKQHQAWSQGFDDKVSETLPEGLACAGQLLTTLASGRKLEHFESVRNDLNACLTLVAAAERQLKRLRNSHRVLAAAESASVHDFQAKGLLQKIESTALGIVTMMVLPLPGSIEVGTVGIGMMWLEGDAANSHLAMQHPTGVPLAPMLERLGSCPPPRAAVILAGWASGGHRGVVLVHNSTPRRITVTATPDKTSSLGAKAFAKLKDAHPMVKLVGYAMTESDGGDHVATILPTDVVLIQVPDDASGSGQVQARLEFSYGPATHSEKTVGWAVVKPGSALSFVRLDSSLQVSNGEGENASVEEGTIRLVNNDLAAVTVSVYRAPEKQTHFESALLTESLEPGDERRVPLPQPCAGCIFQLEVKHAGKQKAVCEVRAGQCVTIDSAEGKGP